jgi:hypothetical protein
MQAREASLGRDGEELMREVKGIFRESVVLELDEIHLTLEAIEEDTLIAACGTFPSREAWAEHLMRCTQMYQAIVDAICQRKGCKGRPPERPGLLQDPYGKWGVYEEG